MSSSVGSDWCKIEHLEFVCTLKLPIKYLSIEITAKLNHQNEFITQDVLAKNFLQKKQPTSKKNL